MSRCQVASKMEWATAVLVPDDGDEGSSERAQVEQLVPGCVRLARPEAWSPMTMPTPPKATSVTGPLKLSRPVLSALERSRSAPMTRTWSDGQPNADARETRSYWRSRLSTLLPTWASVPWRIYATASRAKLSALMRSLPLTTPPCRTRRYPAQPRVVQLSFPSYPEDPRDFGRRPASPRQ